MGEGVEVENKKGGKGVSVVFERRKIEKRTQIIGHEELHDTPYVHHMVLNGGAWK